MTLQQAYQKARDMLNDQQKTAVETINGPVLVIAGPGTGKTQVLTLRIREILNTQDGIESGNILCLTYTNAGVVAMRKRLLDFIGPEAHKVQIHTFHSFCNQVIQENAEYFGVRESENISELEQFEILESILDALSADHPLFHKSSYGVIRDLLSLIGTLKSENWSAEDVEKAVHEYLTDIPSRPEFQYKRKYKEFNAGDANPKKIQAEKEKMDRLLAGAKILPKYQEQLKKRGMYDYSDMILWIIDAFQKKEILLARYQEQFQYILVDEFQDTNGSQKKIVDLLCSYWDDPNIFVVGDDDQSIYRFQGANMRNIMDFYHQFTPPPTVITIEKNYRSSQNILDIAQHIIEKNTERLISEIPEDISKHLTAENPEWKDEPLMPILTEYYNTYHQEYGIIKNLKAIQEKGIPLSKVAVIYQNHSQVDHILKICEQEKIPVRVKETENILDMPIIHHCIELLQYFFEEEKNPYSREDILFRSLFFSFFKLNPADIGLLALWRREDPANRHFKTILRDEEQLQQVPGMKHPEKLFDIGTILSALEEDYVNKTLVHFLESIFEKTGLLHFIFSQAEKSYLLRALSTFFQFVKQEALKTHNCTVADILKKLDRMRIHGISLPIQKILYEKDGVHFITAHSSKGLEFEYVYLIGVEKKIWDRKQARGFSFPDTLTLSNEGDFLEEKRRLFFVAITRAKKFVEVSYCSKNEEGKDLDPSIFISELSEKLTPQKKEYSETEITEYQMRLLQSGEQKQAPIIEKEMIKHILEDYRMSATHLNKYLDCPLAFYFENLLRIPSAMSPHAAFGTAIHNALEKGYRHAESEGVWKDDSQLLETFEKSLVRARFAFSEVEFKKFLKHGKKVLAQYFQKNLSQKEVKNMQYEYHLSTHIAGVPATGNIDRIDFIEPSLARVIDYKTGSAQNPLTRKKMETPSDKNNQLGGDYWRQMVFYDLLVENNPRASWRMHEGVIDFVEPDKSGHFVQKVFSLSQADKTAVKEQIKTTYERIQNMDFTGCHKQDCQWCNRFRE